MKKDKYGFIRFNVREIIDMLKFRGQNKNILVFADNAYNLEKVYKFVASIGHSNYVVFRKSWDGSFEYNGCMQPRHLSLPDDENRSFYPVFESEILCAVLQLRLHLLVVEEDFDINEVEEPSCWLRL